MMRFLTLLLAMVLATHASAWTHGNAGPQGQVTLNLGQAFNSGAGIDYPYINYIKQWTPTIPNPGILDGNGYPASSPGSNISGQITTISQTQTTNGVTWVLRWSGQCGTASSCFQMTLPTSVTSDPGACVVGSTAVNTTLKGTSCRIEFNFTTNPNGIGISILAGAELNGSLTNLALYRKSDEAAYNANMVTSTPFGGFTPEYITALRALNLRTIRYVNYNCVNHSTNNLSADAAMQTPVRSMSYAPNYFSALWAGTAAGSGANAAYQVTAPGGVTTLSDGLSMQLQFTSAGTGAMTLSIDGGVTNKPIADLGGKSGGAITAATWSAGVATFTLSSVTYPLSGDSMTISGVTPADYNVSGSITEIDSTHFSMAIAGDPGAYVSGGVASGGVTSIGAASNWTVVYDALLGKWIANNTAAFTCMPIPVMVALSNALNLDMWFNIPPHSSLAYVTSAATTIRDTLVNTANYEFANELWNFTYNSTKWSQRRGFALGFPNANNEREYGAAGLRIRQIDGTLATVYTGRSNYRRVIMGQAINSGNFSTYTLKGTDLNPTSNQALCLWLGGTYSGSCSGAPNYSALPNRPIDYADAIGYAVYWVGAQLRDSDSSYTSTQSSKSVIGATSTNPTALNVTAHGYLSGQHITVGSFTGGWTGANIGGTTVVSVPDADHLTIAVDASGFASYSANGGSVARFSDELNAVLSAADAFASGGVGIATGVALIDADIRSGTNYSVAGSSTLDTFNGTYYPAWETIAASFHGVSQRPVGMADPVVLMYEGALQFLPPSASVCTTLGISSSYCGNSGSIANLMGWSYPPAAGSYRTSANFQATAKRQFDQMMAGGGTIGVASHSLYPAWLLLANVYTGSTSSTCGGEWALNSCDVFTGTPYTSYNMIQNYHYPFLLKRDLDPASNDNDPMWLEKAA